MKKLLFIFSLCLVSLMAEAQTIYLDEPFTAGFPFPAASTTLSANGWTTVNVAIAAGMGRTVISPLTYPASGTKYVNSGINNGLYNNYNGVSGNSSVSYKQFTATPISSGIVFLSFIYQCTAKGGSNSQVIHLSDSPSAGNGATIWCAGDASNVRLGVTRSSSTSTDVQYYGTAGGAGSLVLNSIHFVVLKYDFSNNKAMLYIDPTIGGIDPGDGGANVFDDGTFGSKATARPNFSYLKLYGNGANKGYFNISGVRISQSWADAVAPKAPPSVTTTAESAITSTGATFNGNITSINGTAITARGFSYKTSSGVVLTDNQTSDGGTAAGTYSKVFTGLAVNTQYFYKAYATNAEGTTLSSTETSFYTLADAPSAPTVNNAQPTTLDVTVNSSTNPSTTQFAIYETSTSQYVQTDGTLGASAVWQTASGWGTKTITGLTSGTSYTFEVKARNGANTETAFGATANLLTTGGSSPILSAGAISANFGNQCLNLTAGPSNFSLIGSALTGDVTVGALTGFTYSSTSGGTYTSTLTITPGSGSISQIVYVKFTPTAVQSYNGDIAVSGGGASSVNCSVTGSGVNTLPTVTTTSPATAITNTTVTLSGNVSDAGCQTITARGFCYGTSSNPDLTATVTTESGTTGAVSSNITGLTPNTTYHFRAYATSSAGTSYGADVTFLTWPNAPSAQPTNISFSSILSTSLTSSFTAASGGADNYLVLRGTSAPTGTPVNGTSYSQGNTNIGGGTNTVAYAGPLTTFNETGLTPNTTYYYTIYSYNGTGATANYLTTSPATANQLTARNQITSKATGNWSSTNSWNGGIVPGQYDDVIIAAGHTIELSANATCNNLTINSTGKLVSAAAKTLVIKGSTLTCDGILGDAVLATSSLTIEFGANLDIKGTPTNIYIFKLKPTTGLSNIGVTFNANVTVTGTGSNILYDNTGNDNISYTVNSPCTLTLNTNFGMASSISTPSTASGTLTINTDARVNVTGTFAPNVASGKTFTGTIDGILAVNGSSNLYSTATSGGISTITIKGTYNAANLNVTPSAAAVAPVVNVESGGVLTVSGTADFSNTSVVGYIGGSGIFNLSSTGTISLAHASGLEPVAGPIRTATRNFNTAAKYSYVGSVSQVTGSDLPATVNTLTIGNTAGVTLSSNTTTSILTTNASSILNVPGGKQLSVNTTLTNNGTLNLQSNISGTATILTPATISGTGTTNVQQSLTAGRNWYVSSPVSNATSNVFTAASNILYSYDETNAAWPQITNNVTGLGVMTGYVANMATEGAVTFTGALNTGAQQISLSRHTGIAKEGFNLVGNPYPSYLNFESALASTSTANVSQTMWFRSKNADTYVFDAFNALNHIGTSNNNNNLIGVTAEIPPMQAVWVRVDVGQTTGTLAVDNTMRSHQDQSIVTNRFKAPAINVPVLHLQVTNGTTSDEAIVLFNSNASNGYDAYDSEKMTNANASIPEIYTLAGTEQLVINGLNSIQYDTEIPLGFTTGQSNTFTIKASQFSNFVSGTQIILRDKLVGTEQDLTVADYSFSSDIVSTSNRFSLIFRAPSVATGINSASNNNTWISTNSNNQVVINGGGSVVIYNAVGQKLSAKNLTANTTVIETPLQSGVYMVAVTNAGKTLTQKVIIK